MISVILDFRLFLSFVLALKMFETIWQFLTLEAAETLCAVCVPPEEHILEKKNTRVIDLSKTHLL